ncbi:MAG TPA: type II toxin-antitoxin system VapC family toxin [Candidatus Nanoarchaeia archaeon]|nr:type II toxin-antitoxin system VapC family toxin [Candidatus Nanoarchaeia archaeon]
MIYLDTNIFLYPLLGTDKKAEECIKILNQMNEGKIKAGTSVLTWDEFYYKLVQKIGKEKTKELSKDFLMSPNLIIFEANKKTIYKAQEMVDKHNLKPRDAIHSATAILNNCTHIASDDKDFDTVTELKRIKIE